MRTIVRDCSLVLLLAAPVLAQNLHSTPAPAVSGPAYDVGVGYTNMTMALPSAGHVNLNGLDVSGSVSLGPRWGVTADSSYLRTSNVLGTSHQGYVLNFHTGPVFYPLVRRNTRVFIHGLAGANLVDGALPVSDTEYFHGWLARFSYMAGGGVEHAVSPTYALRVSTDYLRTAFYNSAGTVQPQNNLQVTVSVVFRLRERRRRSKAEVW